MYLTSFCPPPPALVVRMLFTPLLNRVIPAGKIAGVGLKPRLLTVLLPPCLAGLGLAHLLPIPHASVRGEIPAAVNTPLLLPVCMFHPCILRKRAAYEKKTRATTEALLRHTKKAGPNRLSFLGHFQLSPTIVITPHCVQVLVCVFTGIFPLIIRRIKRLPQFVMINFPTIK